MDKIDKIIVICGAIIFCLGVGIIILVYLSGEGYEGRIGGIVLFVLLSGFVILCGGDAINNVQKEERNKSKEKVNPSR